jgi:hypothetical protein
MLIFASKLCIKKMKINLLIFLLTMFTALSCTHKKPADKANFVDTIPMMVLQIQKCSRLYTTEFRVHKIITHDDQKKLTGRFLRHDFSIDLPLGKRKVAIPMDATLKAYVDFSDFSADQIHRRGRKIEIILPDPRVTLTSSRINNRDVRQFVALTRSRFTDEELSAYERQGRQAIINDIPRMGIIAQAQESAARILIPMLRRMGYEEQNITITFRKQFTFGDIVLFLNQISERNEKVNP